jgi:hypothetical protein
MGDSSRRMAKERRPKVKRSSSRAASAALTRPVTVAATSAFASEAGPSWAIASATKRKPAPSRSEDHAAGSVGPVQSSTCGRLLEDAGR